MSIDIVYQSTRQVCQVSGVHGSPTDEDGCVKVVKGFSHDVL